ncbi:MAG TPA: acyltransferase domain-containing protein [Luteibacter sp.]|jgi:[acyl-carrier-protein] S-malonyltransferase|nr:acyltransferase domain-containing protein [Luteibacter sp.]
MRLAILCSGQGRQHRGMFDLTGDAPEAAALFAHAAIWFGQDPRTWVRTAGEAALHENRNAQLLCTLQSLGAAAALAEALPAERCVAGYSVGEVAAWGVAGLVAPELTLDLVVARADAMNAARQGAQGMLFVRGLDRPVVDALTAYREAAIAIVNPGDAYVLAGMRPALEDIAAEATGKGASRVASVGVEVASHTRFMAAASASFRQHLAQVPMAHALKSGTRLFSGVDGAGVFNVAQGAAKLALQISHPIQWAACLDACIEAGADAFLELGPGRALADMVAGTYPGIAARSLDEFKSLQGVRTWLAKN